MTASRKRSKVKKPIQSTSETALQRAILNRETCILDGIGVIKWLDIELPVNGGRTSGRGKCVDLIGKCEYGHVLCELKFLSEKSKSDEPEYAFNELQGYCKMISENWQELESLNLHHPDCDRFLWEQIASDINTGRIVKIIAANTAYWHYWLHHRSKEILPIIKQDYTLCSINIEPDTFKKQKGNQSEYTPFIDISSWEIL